MKLLVFLLLEIYWLLLRLTIRPQIHGLEKVDEEILQGLVPIFAVPHHTILLSALAYPNRPATLLASLSKDGEFAADFMKRRGFALVRGSSSRGGKEALLSLMGAIDLGHPVAITFDGPRGPRLKPKAGIAVCGWHASGSMFLMKHSLEPVWFFPRGLCVRLKSWDRFVIPLPGCRLRIEFSKLSLPQKTTHSREEWVSFTLNELEMKTLEFYGEKGNKTSMPESGSA